MNKRCFRTGLPLVLALALAGCGQGGEQPASGGKEEEPAVTEPVTLTLYSHLAAINTEKDLEALFGAVRKKLPNITIEQKKGKLEDMIAAGEVPDLIATTHYYMNDIIQLGLVSDLNEFVKRRKVDLNRFEPKAIEAVRSYGKNGELYGIPYTLNYGVLIYNKTIFDKFAAPYPKDGMTWSEVTELARKVTRVENGTSYIGIDPGSPRTVGRGYSLPVVDEKLGKSLIDTDGYKSVMSMMKRIYDIPGIVDPKKNYSYGINYFMKDQKMAMFPSWIAAITSRLMQLEEQGQSFDWDIVSHPAFDDKPGIGREIEFQSLIVTPTSKHKEAAYRLIEAMVGDESQTIMNRGTNLTVLNKPELKSEFAKDTKLYDGKNLSGVFKVKPASIPATTVYDTKIYSFLGDAMKSMIVDGADLNSALRAAGENADKYIQEVRSAK
ncbi:ABC transporter substrate-binding protein [Paenibacillus sp. GYB003]|uniref:ABC transporter substrate-binding protein n=1 Tax=Paenibacillus sp. GYB003 TaxID=2994392 RepID=UPI002F960B88